MSVPSCFRRRNRTRVAHVQRKWTAACRSAARLPRTAYAAVLTNERPAAEPHLSWLGSPVSSPDVLQLKWLNRASKHWASQHIPARARKTERAGKRKARQLCDICLSHTEVQKTERMHTGETERDSEQDGKRQRGRIKATPETEMRETGARDIEY